jgi:hypothetical protein
MYSQSKMRHVTAIVGANRDVKVKKQVKEAMGIRDGLKSSESNRWRAVGYLISYKSVKQICSVILNFNVFS